MTTHNTEDRMSWWRDARFGMFIHWGLYSIAGRGEWIYYQEHWDTDEYAKLADQFNPQHFDARDWVKMAQDAGMKYMVLTTRHHDGFCLYDSDVSDFTAPKTAAGRDFIEEYVDACNDLGMRIGFYYSLGDWRFPGVIPHGQIEEDRSIYEPLVNQAHAQIRELMTNYGKVDILWYDGGWPGDIWRPEELNGMARSLQPNIIINDRSGTAEDYGTPENEIKPMARPWEACYTMNDSWGYALWDLNYKSTTEILHLLSTCTSNGGNLLLNVGPDADGRFPDLAVDRLRNIGQWMQTHGDAIYGVEPSPVVANAMGYTARSGNTVYIHVWRWPGRELPIGWCGSQVARAHVLGSDARVSIRQEGDRVWLTGLPEYPPDMNMSVIALEFDEPPKKATPAYA
jgi:alpha-L-fucosidase